MNIVKFPVQNGFLKLDEVVNRYKSGEYQELYITAVRSDGTLETIDITRIAIDRLQALATS